MLDRFNRNIHYLRISVTDRYNLRCTYCMPPEGFAHKSRAEILHFEEIEQIVRAASSLGIDKVRLTGGEPLGSVPDLDFLYLDFEVVWVFFIWIFEGFCETGPAGRFRSADPVVKRLYPIYKPMG